jgi:hypothetical protein
LATAQPQINQKIKIMNDNKENKGAIQTNMKPLPTKLDNTAQHMADPSHSQTFLTLPVNLTDMNQNCNNCSSPKIFFKALPTKPLEPVTNTFI